MCIRDSPYPIRRTCKWCHGSGRAAGPRQAVWVPPAEEETMVRFDTFPTYRPVKTGIITPGRWQELGGSQPRCPDCLGRGVWGATRTRTAQFLSAFDTNETRPSYFFCELPPGSQATTIEEAYETLKPDAVRLAEQMGRTVFRQGDIFAIPLVNATKRGLRKQGARFERRGSLFGTNHVGTEVAYLPNGTTLVRGVLHHAPEFRRPDHKRVRLGDGWHVVLKNLVPTTG